MLRLKTITPKYAVHVATRSNTNNRVVLFNAAEENNPTFFEPVNNSGIGVLLHEGCYCVPYMKVHICVGILNSFLGKVLKGLWKKRKNHKCYFFCHAALIPE